MTPGLGHFSQTGWVIFPLADDEAVVSALTNLAESKPLGWGTSYTLRVVGVRDHRVDLEIRQDLVVARVWLALPSSGRPMPWMQVSAPDADGWVRDLVDWLNEEMDTGGITARTTKTDTAGVSRLIVDGYGLRVEDSVEHRRLRSVVGPNGWGHERGRRNIRRQYTLEWALDEVEVQIRDPEHERDKISEQRSWSLVSPDGIAVLVEAAAAGNESHLELNLRAISGNLWSQQTASRRLSF